MVDQHHFTVTSKQVPNSDYIQHSFSTSTADRNTICLCNALTGLCGRDLDSLYEQIATRGGIGIEGIYGFYFDESYSESSGLVTVYFFDDECVISERKFVSIVVSFLDVIAERCCRQEAKSYLNQSDKLRALLRAGMFL